MPTPQIAGRVGGNLAGSKPEQGRFNTQDCVRTQPDDLAVWQV